MMIIYSFSYEHTAQAATAASKPVRVRVDEEKQIAHVFHSSYFTLHTATLRIIFCRSRRRTHDARTSAAASFVRC